MSPKYTAIIAYLSIIGWLIAFQEYHKRGKNPLVQYHLEQAFGGFILGCVYGSGVWVIALKLPSLAAMLSWAGILYFILLGMGMINALNETKTPIPLIGRFFENRFSFIY